MISKPLKICKTNYLWGDLLSHEYKLSILLLASSLLAGMAIAADEMGEYNVDLATNETLGTYLVNETGFSLYYFANDSPGNGSSTCYWQMHGGLASVLCREYHSSREPECLRIH